MPNPFELWLPILVAAIAVHILSAILHMALPYHRKDYGGVPDENALLTALRGLAIPPGNYNLPYAGDGATARSPEVQQKMKEGPLALLRIRAGGSFNMAATLLQWFIYLLVVNVLIACLALHALSRDSSSTAVTATTGLAALLAYGAGQPIESIWFWRNWSTTAKNIFDAVLFGITTGLVFCWLWPG